MKKRLLRYLVVLTGVFLLSSSTVWATDLPMVVCEEAVFDDDGSFINIGTEFNRHSDTARWTNYEPCSDGRINANEIIDLITCDRKIDPDPMGLGASLATSVGITKRVLEKVRDCFFEYDPPRMINVILPAVDCDGDKFPAGSKTCGPLIGALDVNIIWVSTVGYGASDVPIEILTADGLETEWYGGDIADETERWQSFANHFNLQELGGGKPAMVDKKSIYFKVLGPAGPPVP